MSRYQRFILFLLFFTQLIPDLSSQVYIDNFDDYLLKNWDSKHGLPQNTVQAIIQDHRGYLWVGTQSGLARFDGSHIQVFSGANAPQFTNDNVISLFEDDRGVLWIGTDGSGIFNLKKEQITPYTPPGGYLDKHIRCISGDHNGHLWFGTDFGVIEKKGDQTRLITTQNGLYDNVITALETDSDGRLWIGTIRGGLALYRDKVIRIFGPTGGLFNNNVLSLKTDRTGHLYIGTIAGLFRMDLQNFTITYYASTSDTPIEAITPGHDGIVWLASKIDGLTAFKNDILTPLAVGRGFPDDDIRALFTDESGRTWVGTGKRGLVSLNRRSIQSLPLPGTAAQSAATAIYADVHQNIWVGTQRDGLFEGTIDGPFQPVKIHVLPQFRINAIGGDKTGTLCFGLENNGLIFLDKKRWKIFPDDQHFSSTRVLSVLDEKEDLHLAGTSNGLFLISATRMIKQINGFDNDSPVINVLTRSEDGHILIGTESGFYWLSDLKAKKILPLKKGAAIPVTAIAAMGDNHVLIGTNGRGLLHWPQRDNRSLTTREGLPDNHIFSIINDNNGRTWFSSNSGLFAITQKDLEAFFNGQNNVVTPLIFDENDGMRSRQCAAGVQPASLLTGNKLYVSTARGVAVVDTRRSLQGHFPVRIAIDKILLNGSEVYSKRERLTLPGSGTLEIFIRFIDFHNPDRVRIKWRLSGVDSTDRFAVANDFQSLKYTSLEPGRYELTVDAANHLGEWTDRPFNMSIDVAKPFYKRSPFIILMLFLALVLSLAIYFLQKRREQKKALGKYKTSGLTDNREETIRLNLEREINDEKIYLDPDLTLKGLAARLHIHSNYLSQLINKQYDRNFNDFINFYRIEEVVRHFKDPGEKERNILEIMYDCGFYSKSVFNTAFKKFTGMTPSEYRKKQHSVTDFL